MWPRVYPFVRPIFQASSRVRPPACRALCSASDSDKLPPSLRQKYKTFDEEEKKVVRDFHEELYGFQWEEKHRPVDDESFYMYRDKKKPVQRAELFSNKRGVRGVFDIEDLVEALRSENVIDLSVVRIPEHAHYCDYMVIATAKSRKHMTAVLNFLRKLYKNKKAPRDPELDPAVGEKAKSNWQIMDLDFIVLHIFEPGVREVYDLETLWCVGPEYDDNTVRPKYDSVIDFMEKHVKLIEQMTPDSGDPFSQDFSERLPDEPVTAQPMSEQETPVQPLPA